MAWLATKDPLFLPLIKGEDLFDFGKNPRITKRTAGDQNAIAFGLFKRGKREWRGMDVAIGEHRNGNALFDLADHIPVRKSAVTLRFCASMNGDEIRPRIFNNFTKFKTFRGIAPTRADFD